MKLEYIYSIWAKETNLTSESRFREETNLLMHPLYANTLAALDENATGDEVIRHEKVTLDDTGLKVVSVGDPAAPLAQGLRGHSSRSAAIFVFER